MTGIEIIFKFAGDFESRKPRHQSSTGVVGVRIVSTKIWKKIHMTSFFNLKNNPSGLFETE